MDVYRTPDAPSEPDSAPPMCRFGVASFALAVFAYLTLFGTIGYVILVDIAGDRLGDEDSLAALGFELVSLPVGAATYAGCLLAVMSLLRPGRNHLFAWLGLAGNLFGLLAVAGLMVLDAKLA